MSKLLRSNRPLRIRRPLVMKGARVITGHFAAFWTCDEILRRIARATGDHELAARTANAVYRKLVGRAS